MYFSDLGAESQICTAAFVRAIGWLDPRHAFSKGPTPPPFRARLQRFADRWGDSTEALGWPVAGGAHHCPFCGAFSAAGNFGVIADETLYVCPEMVAHYVREHDYRPPDPFLAAVMECPLPWAARYQQQARRFWQAPPSNE